MYKISQTILMSNVQSCHSQTSVFEFEAYEEAEEAFHTLGKKWENAGNHYASITQIVTRLYKFREEIE